MIPPIDNPVALLLDRYRRMQREPMAGLPPPNAALEVEILEFRPREGRWGGLLITPWFVNFILLPLTPGEWANIPEGARARWIVAGREVEFVAHVAAEIGPFQMHTLISPVTGLADQSAAREAAIAALDRLFNPPEETQPAPAAPAGRREADRSRRGFFRSLLAPRKP